MAEWQQTSHSQIFESSSLSPHSARAVVRDVCTQALVPPPMVDTALLLVSEVVTNAVTHGAGRPVLDIDVGPQTMRVTVTDDGAGLPRVVRDSSPLAAGGRGLRLVDALAARWGANRRVPSGKSVWFELDRG